MTHDVIAQELAIKLDREFVLAPTFADSRSSVVLKFPSFLVVVNRLSSPLHSEVQGSVSSIVP